jgi:hypothetical protein
METNQKMAITGAGLVVAGIGVSVVGAALIAPAVFAWAARLAEKGADNFAASVEGASRTVGTVAGTLHRSFSEAKKAGVSEIKRARSNERTAAG